MNLSDRILRIFSTIVFTFLLTGSLSAQQGTLEELREKFKKGQIFFSKFTHSYIDSYTQDTTSSKGVIWVGEDRYKVQAQNQSVVVDGKTSMVYDENRNRVIISEYDPAEDDFAPSRILSGIDSTFTVEHQEERNGSIYLKLTSDDPFAIYQKVEIVLSLTLVPQRIEAWDPADNIIISLFERGKFIRAKQGMFDLNYPEGAEVIDMRN